MTRPVLVTRAAPGARATAAKLERAGFDAVLAPVADIVFEDDPPDLAGIAALAFTSPNGVRAFARLSERRDPPVFAVGDATAEAAREAGFASVRSAQGDGADLARLIAKARPGRVLHVRGRDLAFDLAGALAEAGIAADETIAYRAEPVDALPPGAIEALRSGCDVLIHSRKGAERLLDLADGDALAPCGFAAISEAAAEPLRAAGLARIIVAARPDEAALIDALGRLRP
ncbi:uroporphyrinogen-III synthase [Marinicauda salina]|uniref:Uroporphyrinogen-III synthase n=1 Tax=Marinicauda salina TaxID=2135793 RepID=A0A2U2BW26_9PROT|nr:uroporphyrinogen-III synthase [Marinicauda salina]PWE18197.1 uroporphyrinogen-III synthase [Marinicauda salina]